MPAGSSKKKKPEAGGDRVVARNRRARHEYQILETVEAGLVLRGTEVKSLREGRAAIEQAYARIEGGEAWLIGANIPEYGSASWTNHDPQARRKLLLHRRQIKKLEAALQGGGRTLVPLQIHFNERGPAKVLLALASGMKKADRRQDVARRDAEREMERAVRRRG